MGLTVNVTRLDESAPVIAGKVKEDTGSAGVLELVRCDVVDDEHFSFGPSFEYHVSHRADGGADIHLVGMRVGGPHGVPGYIALGTSVSEIRDLPLARWEQAARGTLAAKYVSANELLMNGGFPSGSVPHGTEIRPPKDVDLAVHTLFPELEGDDTPSGVRRRKSLRRLVEVSTQYMDLLRDGRSDPAAEIARSWEVSPSTARSWIYRARRSGLLGPAVGRSAGVEGTANLANAIEAAEATLAYLRGRLAELEGHLKDVRPAEEWGDPTAKLVMERAQRERTKLHEEIERREDRLATARAALHADVGTDDEEDE